MAPPAADVSAALSALDRQRMDEALALAEQAIGLSSPNPRVGCVIGHADGRVLGRGHTQRVGGPHAEVMALRNAAAAGHAVRGATAWVTLEPCAHHGRTPPCCDALVEAGIARVVVAGRDPFPLVAGRGLGRLRAAGIEVAEADGPQACAARALNIGFFSRIERGRPWVRLKVAVSLDGHTALTDGTSQWITGPEARRDNQAWRRRSEAVLTGVGTILADDPRLDVRDLPSTVQPLRVVLDSRWRTPPRARVLAAPGRALVVGTVDDPAARRRLEAAGAETALLETDADGRVALEPLLHLLAQRGVNELHLEAGATLSGAWVRSGLVDAWLIYVAPCLVGPGRPLAELPALAKLSEARRLHAGPVRRVGDDLCWHLASDARAVEILDTRPGP